MATSRPRRQDDGQLRPLMSQSFYGAFDPCDPPDRYKYCTSIGYEKYPPRPVHRQYKHQSKWAVSGVGFSCLHKMFEILKTTTLPRYQNIHFILSLANRRFEFSASDRDDNVDPSKADWDRVHSDSVCIHFDCRKLAFSTHLNTELIRQLMKIMGFLKTKIGTIQLPWAWDLLDTLLSPHQGGFNARYMDLVVKELPQESSLIKRVFRPDVFPNVRKIRLRISGVSSAVLTSLLGQLGSFPRLSRLEIESSAGGYLELWLPSLKVLSASPLLELKFRSLYFPSTTALGLLFDEWLEQKGIRLTRLEISNCVIRQSGFLNIFQQLSKLPHLKHVELEMTCFDDVNPLAPEAIDLARAAYRTWYRKSLSLEYIRLKPNRHICEIVPQEDIYSFRAFPAVYRNISSTRTIGDKDHYLKLNKAGRRAIRDLPCISPPAIAVNLLDKANRVYQANGIYHLLREHADLRTIVAKHGVQEGMDDNIVMMPPQKKRKGGV